MQRVAQCARMQKGCMVAIGNRCYLDLRYMRYVVTGGSGTNEAAVKFNPGIIAYDEADVLLCCIFSG